MSLLMEFLVADVATRSLLMSFVKDNYGLLSVAEELDEKLALYALCEDSAFSSPCTLGDLNDLPLLAEGHCPATMESSLMYRT